MGYVTRVGSALPTLRRFLRTLEEKGYKWDYLLKVLGSIADAVFNPEAEESTEAVTKLPGDQVLYCYVDLITTVNVMNGERAVDQSSCCHGHLNDNS